MRLLPDYGRLFRVVAFLSLFLGCVTAAAQTGTIGLNFTASNRGESGSIPPDTMGTVGPNHIVEMINGRYKVFDKADGQQLSTSSLNSFWNSTGVTPDGVSVNSSFDPRVVYDPATERFFAVSADHARADNNFLLAVSQSSNPLDGWTGFSIDSDSDTGQRWADYPMLGFNGDFVYVGANMFEQTDVNFSTQRAVLAVPKADLVAATPTFANATLFEDVDSITGSSPHPAIDLDNVGGPAPLWSGDESAFSLRRSNISGSPSSPSLNFDTTVSTTVGFTAPDGDQPGTKQNLDNIGLRFSSALVLQEGSYWGTRVVSSSFKSAVRWYEIDAATNALLQEGLITDPDLDLLYPSIAVNELGDVVIGFTGTSENQFPSAYAVVGATNAQGVTAFGNLMLLKEGVADYERLDGADPPRNRWGDYSATVIDPSDPLSFWTFQEFVSATNEWSVQISQIITQNFLAGDVNLDGSVDDNDILAFVAGWKTVLPTDDTLTAWGKGDLNLDRVSDLADAYLLHQALLGGGGSFDLALLDGVPEPSGVALLLLALALTPRQRRGSPT